MLISQYKVIVSKVNFSKLLIALFYYQLPYATFPYSMMTIFVMTLGELNYADLFMPWDKLEYATLTNILFFLFVLGMPIILMNMLVSTLMSLHHRKQSEKSFLSLPN